MSQIFNKSGVNLTYIGKLYSFVFLPGKYLFELWGASGGGQTPGFGAFVSGETIIKKLTKMYVYVGQKGLNNNTLSFNGGGAGCYKNNTSVDGGSSGGGATDIRLINGDWDDFSSLKSRIIVAGGGGGSQLNIYVTKGGDAGILEGFSGSSSGETVGISTGGKQDEPGIAGTCELSSGTDGFFGKGGSIFNNINGNGGGGGYFGGAAGGVSSCTVGSGAGGSSFISGYEGCEAINKSSSEQNPSFYSHPYHYSGFVFRNITALDGSQTKWDNDGMARITLLARLPGTINHAIYRTNNFFTVYVLIFLLTK